MRLSLSTIRMPASGGLPRRRFRRPGRLFATVSFLTLAGCASVDSRQTLDPPTDLALYQPAAGAGVLQFHRDRLNCANTSSGPLGACLADLGHPLATTSAADAVADNAYFGSTEPQPLAFAMLGANGFYTGATELFPHTEVSAIILNQVEGTSRCDGTARIVRASPGANSLGGAKRFGGDGIVQCDSRSVITLRLTLDTPNSGRGIGQDSAGATYAVLFGPPALAAKANHEAVRAMLTTMLPPPPTPGAVPSAAAVRSQFRADDFVLNRVRTGSRSVPHRYLTSLPVGLAEDDQILRRKDLFIKVMLPLVLLSNQATLADRAHMLQLISRLGKGHPITTTNQLWLNRLAQRFESAPDDFATLRYRIDAIPPSLAIAQAALETGWGTSRFANQGNALFGEWTFGERRGIVPASRGPQKDHKVRSFDSLLHSVLAYMDNLNSHPAYRDMRAKRASSRAYGNTINSQELALHLNAYGGDAAYITKVNQVIRSNRLRAFDDANLQSMPIFGLPSPKERPAFANSQTNQDRNPAKSLVELFLK